MRLKVKCSIFCSLALEVHKQALLSLFSPVRDPGASTGAGAETSREIDAYVTTQVLCSLMFNFLPNLLWSYIFVQFHFLSFKDTFAKMKSAREIKAKTTPQKSPVHFSPSNFAALAFTLLVIVPAVIQAQSVVLICF